ncbi:MAG: hypothetical protein ACOZBW_01610 [Thermodesulfobacteriota bacterium]
MRDLTQESEHAVRRGCARVLIEHLEALAAEPEFLYDLMPGEAKPGDAYFRQEAFPAQGPRLTPETPFDLAGHAGGKYFFYTSGKISTIIAGGAVDPYIVGEPFRSMGPWNYTLEKAYASPKPTTMHVAGEEVFDRVLSGRSFPPVPAGKGHLVIADPRGLARGGKAVCIATLPDLNRAIRLADQMGELLDIRFVVGTPVYVFNSR